MNQPEESTTSPPEDASGFHAIKAIPIPWDEIEAGVVGVCRSINELSFAVTTGMSGGTYKIGDGTDGHCAINYGHITVALDSSDPKSDIFIGGISEICEKFPEIELRRRERNVECDHAHPPIDCDMIVDVFVRCEAMKMSGILVREELIKIVRTTTDDQAIERAVSDLNIRAHEIPVSLAQNKIQQFEECMTQIVTLARSFDDAQG